MLSASELNIKMQDLIQISSHENMLLKTIEKFYESLNNVKDFIAIINSKSDISIRLIDYFITKYSKKNKISYKIENNIFNIYQSYKQQLKLFQKKNFDPFARGIRIPYYIENIWIITTIGQLNFYKWFLSKNIFEYINKNKVVIEYDMNKNKKNKNDKKKNKSYKIYKKIEPKLIPLNIHSNITKNKNLNSILVTF